MLGTVFDYKVNITSLPCKKIAVDCFSSLLSLQNYHLPSDSVYEINNYLSDTWMTLVETSALFLTIFKHIIAAIFL